MVIRDILPDGGAQHIALTVAAVRRKGPGVAIEVLISDLGGNPDSLRTVLNADIGLVSQPRNRLPVLLKSAPASGLPALTRTAGRRRRALAGYCCQVGAYAWSWRD